MKKTKMVSKVHQVAYHRNGVGGEGFHAVVFDHENEHCANCNSFDGFGWVDAAGVVQPCHGCGSTKSKISTQKMLGIVFDGPGRVAILDIDKLTDPAIGVAFGENSWRGDRFEAELRAAIESNPSDGSVRLGPFAIPVVRGRRP